MSELVEMLLHLAYGGSGPISETCADAAKEIERLSKQLAKIDELIGIEENETAADRVARLADFCLGLQKQLVYARDYVLNSIATYTGDPASNNFQRGHLAALEMVRDEAFARTADRCTCGGDPDQPASHHDISCPRALTDDVREEQK